MFYDEEEVYIINESHRLGLFVEQYALSVHHRTPYLSKCVVNTLSLPIIKTQVGLAESQLNNDT